MRTQSTFFRDLSKYRLTFSAALLVAAAAAFAGQAETAIERGEDWVLPISTPHNALSTPCSDQPV